MVGVKVAATAVSTVLKQTLTDLAPRPTPEVRERSWYAFQAALDRYFAARSVSR
jgi:hypothetical protein